MKIGIDLHGVSDAYPTFFSELCKLFIAAGHEVIIITGPSVNEATLNEIKACNLSYTGILSIVDYHLAKGTPCHYDENGRYWIDNEPWNRTKADMCREHGIDFHIDDSPIYGEHFTTPYMQVSIKK